MKKIIQIGDKRLLEKSKPLAPKDILSRETQALIDEMIKICDQDPTGTGGLSAVQIGEMKRVFVVNRIDLDEELGIWEVMVNPEMEVIGSGKSTIWEGCLSIGEGDDRLFGPVTRADHVRVTYTDREGKKQKLDAHAYFAHIVQHEFDHLEGILFLRHVKNPVNIWKSKQLDEYLHEFGEFPDIVG